MESIYRSSLILLLLLSACDLSGPPSHWRSVTAVVETQPVKRAGDSADDPAIWRNRDKPEDSLIVASDKRSGLYVYDLNGKELSSLPTGEPNNVDLRELISTDGTRHILVAVSDRKTNAVQFFNLDPVTAELRPLESDLRSELGEIYGLCMYQPEADLAEVIATGRSGKIERYQVWLRESGGVHMGRLAGFDVPSQVEGCVADDATGDLYVAEESVGIWQFDLTDVQREGQLLANIQSGELVADIEGLALGHFEGIQYLVVSSQGNDSFVIYEKNGRRLIYLGTFNVTAGEATDSVSETDGIDLVSTSMGERFPGGLLVVQDGDNSPANQNFKLISWQDIADIFALNPE